MTALKVLFWGSAGLLAWTHVGYPLAAAALARVRPRPVRRDDVTPSVTVVVAAHDEEGVIERRLENLVEQDYPAERFDIVVASDASTDRTDELVRAVAARDPRVRLVPCPRGGKVAAQNLAVSTTDAEVVVCSDANSVWSPDALRLLVRSLADPDVAYVCGQLKLLAPDGSNREGLYWRYEMWLREQESQLGSITGGNGSIYAVRRSDWIDVDPRFGHDLSFPYALAQRGRRSVLRPRGARVREARARHGGGVPPQGADARARLADALPRRDAARGLAALRGRARLPPPPALRERLAAPRPARVERRARRLGRDLRGRASSGRRGSSASPPPAARRLPLPGAGVALYYTLVTWSTVVSCVRYLRFGVPAVWEKAVGTR